jgi:uncharacterized protein
VTGPEAEERARNRWSGPIALGIGIAAGLMSGLLGVGGGIVIVPLMVAFGGLSQHEAHATSLAAIVPIAAVASARFGAEGRVDWALAGLLAVGTLVGAPVGAWLLARMGEGLLKLLLGAVMLIVAVQLLLA